MLFLIYVIIFSIVGFSFILFLKISKKKDNIYRLYSDENNFEYSTFRIRSTVRGYMENFETNSMLERKRESVNRKNSKF